MWYLIALILTIILFKFIFRINIRQIKKQTENQELSEITKRFPEDIEIAKEMLKELNNENVKIEQAKDTGTSLYIALTNKIIIADMKNNYSRIQTIAHECLHSIQDRRLQIFNFVISNINLLYFVIITILTVFKIINNIELPIFIFMILGIIQFSVRSFLEIDAMTKSKYLAKEYIENKKLCSKEEVNKLIEEHDKINKIGIPFVIDNLLNSILIKIVIYVLIIIII
ncbi:MAG: zinc metallopeptidase [Clostridia bacterium]|nr:zinc metallopeptidase [Clostridia bacterium]